MNTKVLVIGAVFLMAIGGVFAWWLIDYQRVDYCYDSDGGANFLTYGSITVSTYNSSQNTTLHDYCLNSTSIGEYLCTDDIPNQPPGYAALIGENCENVNGSIGNCSAGRCI